MACLRKAVKTKGLERAFGTAVPEEVLSELASITAIAERMRLETLLSGDFFAGI